eukprot:TRINITY_DN8156_c0_g1_i12.p2 TRINITY_DN8156_c0_g1~~TRINITY_DN8156_c0_g1_i12.p2  ORF type:complete len:231 (+),score=75.72 TRINITY_DN8156_c0_g1_i12:506-1198(+)
MIKKLLLTGAAGMVLGTRKLDCKGETEAEKVAKELDRLYEEPLKAKTAEELGEYLQSSVASPVYPYLSPATRKKLPSMFMINLPLKTVTSIEVVPGLKVDLSGQLSKGFQISGTWKYNRPKSSFNLNTALIDDPSVSDSSFLAGYLRGDGRLDCRGMVKLGKGYSLSMEAGFQDADHGTYILELGKAFDYSTVTFRAGSTMRGFSYVQALWDNCIAGFECNYIVILPFNL